MKYLTEKRIQEIENILEEVIKEAETNSENNKDQEKEDWPKKGNEYGTLDSKGLVFFTIRDNEVQHLYRKRRKNIFGTEEQAEKFTEVEDKIYEISERYGKIDFTDTAYKWYLTWNLKNNKLSVESSDFEEFIPGVIYCNASNFMHDVTEEIPHEDLRFYFCHLAGVEE